MKVQLPSGAFQNLPIDFCEECGDAHEMERLTRIGCRCERCDPMGLHREGSMLDTLIERQPEGVSDLK